MSARSYDVVILGTGPAGLQAAIHAARRKAAVLVLGKESRSSIYHHHVENYCCIFNTTGEDIIANGRKQAASFGAELLGEDVLKITVEDGRRYRLALESGLEVQAPALILATGTARNRLGVPGEKELLGRGVSYCVECDCNFFKNVEVAVAGGGSAAASGAITMGAYASRVHLVCEKLEVRGALLEELRASPVVLHEKARVKAILGSESVTGLALEGGASLAVQGVFIELGAKGILELAGHLGIQLDEEMKYIATNKKMETSVPGIYAAGDICGPPWQVAKAVGEGCVAGLEAAAYSKKIGK